MEKQQNTSTLWNGVLHYYVRYQFLYFIINVMVNCVNCGITRFDTLADRYNVDIQVCPDQVLGLSHQELPPVGMPHWPHCLHRDECLQDHFGIKVHSPLLMVDNKNIV